MEEKNEKLTSEIEAAVTPDADTEDMKAAAESAQETVENAAEAAQETAEEATKTAEEAAETAQQTAQETAEEAAETVQETAEEATETVQETVEEAVSEAPAPAGKSKLLQRTIIISAAIVVCAVLVALVCRLFFFNGIVGTNLFGSPKETCWHYSTPVQTYAATTDEAQTADYYFIFEPDGTLKIEIGSFEYDGVYTTQYLTKDNAPAEEYVGKPAVSIENTNSIDGVYLYEVTGNVFSGKTMTLTSVYSNDVAFKFDDKAYTAPDIQRDGEFGKDEKVVGSWTNKNEYASQTLRFNEDGTYSISTKTSTSKQVENGLYSCKDGSITLSSYYISTQSQTFKYTAADDKLTIIQEMMTVGDDGVTPITTEQPIEYTKE